MEGFEWRHLNTFRRAWDHHFSEVRKSQSVSGVSAVRLERLDGREPSQETREPWSVRLAKPDKRRVKFQVGDEIATAVFIGGWWWGWSPSQGFITNSGAPNHGHGLGPAEGLMDPARHLESLDLHVDGRTTFLSRPAFLVTAAPRNDEPSGFGRGLHMLGTGADEYKIVIDAAVGVLLRCEARYQGDAFRVIEAEQIGVDEPFSEATFDPDRLRNGVTSL
jgi:hypothetical protein